jgi:hypothetical protein
MPQNNTPASGNPYVKAFSDLLATSKNVFGFLSDPAERQGIRQGITDAVNRGAIATTLGAPVDMANMGLNLGKAAVGYVGNKAGVLSADQMPQLEEKPFLGSEYFGDLMQRGGAVSPNRNALAEMGANFLTMSPTKSAKAVAAIGLGGALPGVDAAAAMVGRLKAVEALFPGKTEAMLNPAEKTALTKYKTILDTPAVMRREKARLFGSGDVIEPSLGVGAEMGVHPNALLDKYIVPVLWDTSATGGKVKQIAGVPLSESVERQGGRMYPYIPENLAQGIGGASNLSAQRSKINNLNKFSEQGDTLAVQMNLAPSGINFSHHMSDAIVGQLPALKPSKDALAAFRDTVQNTAVKDALTGKVTYPYKNFPGIDSKNIREIMAKGVPGEYSAGNIRKVIAETGMAKKIENMGFPRWQDIYKTMSEPGAQTGGAHTIMSVEPNMSIVTPNFKHGSYNEGMKAKLMGSLMDVKGNIVGAPDRLLMPKTFANALAQGKNEGNVRTSMLMSHKGEKFDQQALDALSKYLGY